MALQYVTRGMVAYLTIDNPAQLNALTLEDNARMAELLQEFRDDTERLVLIITGAGDRAFCTGLDLKRGNPTLRGMNPLAAWEMTQTPGFGGLTRNLELYKPVIAAINGYAVGGGHELALACDIRVMADHALVGHPELQYAVMPIDGGTQRLPRTVSLCQAMEIILTGKMVDASEAYRIGLVNRVVPGDQLMATCDEIAARICRLSPSTVMAAKRAILESFNRPLREGLIFESALGGLIAQTPNFTEGSTAFAEKRPARFEPDMDFHRYLVNPGR